MLVAARSVAELLGRSSCCWVIVCWLLGQCWVAVDCWVAGTKGCCVLLAVYAFPVSCLLFVVGCRLFACWVVGLLIGIVFDGLGWFWGSEAALGAIFDHVGHCWELLAGLCGRFLAVLGCSWPLLGRAWGDLGVS